MWGRREIENYFCSRGTLEAYAAAYAPDDASGPLFTAAEAGERLDAMRAAIDEIESALKTLGLPNLMAKKNFYELAEYVPEGEIDREIRNKLDAIASVAESATPAGDQD